MQYDVVIIGSGLGGLLCGAILSKEGMKVCILEKNKRPGGSIQSFQSHGNVFDTGLHYIGSMLPGQPLHDYWNWLEILQSLDPERLNTDCFDRICLREKDYPMAQGFDRFREVLLEKFPGKEASLDHYITLLKQTASAFPMYKLEPPDDRSESPYRNMSAGGVYRELDNESLLPDVLAGNHFLYAGNHATTPFYIPALINHSFISSAFRIHGGGDTLVNALSEKIREAGGTIHTECEVNFIKKENDLFHVSTVSGEEFITKLLVSDIHPANLVAISDPSLFTVAFRKRVSALENTVSSFSLYISLKPDSFPYLDHNVHYFDSPDVWNAGSALGGDWPKHYILYTPQQGDNPAFARSMIIMTTMKPEEVKAWENTTIGNRSREYSEFKAERTEKLMDLAGKRYPEIKKSISAVTAATPLTWQDYTGTPGGSMYGIEKDYNDPVKSMILPRTKTTGLYLTGQNTNIHGALGVTIAAFLTCGEILGIEYLLNKVRNANEA